MPVQSQHNGDLPLASSVDHKVQWASTVAEMTALVFIGGATYLVHRAAGGSAPSTGVGG